MKTSTSRKDDPSASNTPVLLQAADRHERVSAERVAELDSWLDAQLEELEVRFREFVTPSSYKRSAGR